MSDTAMLSARIEAGRRLLSPGVQMPVYLMVFVTTRCDAKCRHCFYWRELNTIRDELTVAEYERLARAIGPTFQVSLTGGSPELRKDLPAIARVFHEHCKPVNMTFCMLGRHTRVIVRQVEEVLRTCPDQRLTVGISLDGLEGEHDAIRGVPRLFSNVIETFTELGRLKASCPRLSLSAAIVVSGLNHESAERTAAWAWENLPIDLLKPIFVRGSPRDPTAIDPRAKDVYLRIVDRDRSKIRQSRRPGRALVSTVIDAKEVVERELITQILATGEAPAVCSAARETVVIYPDGKVAGCEPRSEVLGNLRDVDMDLGRIWFSERADAFRASVGGAPECSGCYHHCFLSPPIFRSPKLWPRLARALWSVEAR